MSEIPEEGDGANQLLDEATLWFARMRGPEAAGHRPAFEAWLARGALHRAAYNRAAEIFSFGKFLAEEAQGPALAPEAPGKAGRHWAFATATVAIAILAGLWLYSHLAGPTGLRPTSMIAGGAPAQLVLQTAPDQGRVERLTDGSTVTLGPDTSLSVRFDEEHRLLTLTRGRARFEVAKEKRSFVVAALGTRVTAHGTVFDVAITDGAKVKVRLFEGRIEVVSPSPGRPAVHRILNPGQSTEIAGEPLASAVQPSSGQATPAAAQPDELHEYDGARLADVIAEANRDAPVSIALADPSLGDLRISGRFRLADTALLAERICTVFDLRMTHASATRVLLSRR
ncbi:FecR family protein [Sphingomonas sp. MMS12-HWE2-04]|uniref:FecR family protein n=1 Tax=Sphingomonas sp. MMS12-HWE2-04 TaxID=3234199 RepID=UPI00384D9145